MKVARLTFAWLLVSLMAGSALAQPPAGRGSGRGRGPGGFGGGGFERLTDAVSKMDLSADQKDKLETLKKEYAPKFKALREKSEKILTDDQKKARDEAMKAAREAKPDDRRAAYGKIRDAVKLTDDQKKETESVMKDVRALFEEVQPKVSEILTDEQKAKLKEAMGSRTGGKRGSRGEKSAAKKESI